MHFDIEYAKIETFVSADGLDAVLEALRQAGAGKVGDSLYDSCCATTNVTGHWRPLEGSDPHIGNIGELASEPEIKVEATVKASLAYAAAEAVREAHPYEEPVIYIIPLMLP